MKTIRAFWQRYHNWLKILGTVALCTFLLAKIPVREVGQQLRILSPITILLSLLTLWLGMTMFALVWVTILRGLDFSITVWQIWNLFFQALFIGNFASFLGGDVVRSYRLGRSTNRMVEVSLSVLISRGLMFYTVTLLTGSTLWLWATEIGWPPTAKFAGGLMTVIAVSAAMLFLLFCRFVKSRPSTANNTSWQLGFKTIVHLGSQTKLMLVVIGQSLIGQLLTVWSVWWLAKGLALPILWWQLLLFLSIMGVALVIPVSLNGLGLREVGLVSLMEQIKVDPAKALALSLVTSLIIVVASLPGGVLMFWDSWHEK